MSEKIKNLNREFSHVEIEMIENFAEKEGFVNILTLPFKNRVKLIRGNNNISFRLKIKEEGIREIEVTQTFKEINFASNPSELNTIINKLK